MDYIKLALEGFSYCLDDENITGYDIDHRANAGIGYAFQQPQDQ